jgi:hypothetical protein
LEEVNFRPSFFLCLIVLSTCLAGCSLVYDSSFQSTIEPSWNPGDSWTVKITYWPGRAANPYAESSNKVVTQWTYRVPTTGQDNSPEQLVISKGEPRYLLEFNRTLNLMTVSELMDSSRSVTKVRNLLKSPTGGKAFLARGWKPDTAVMWVHPDLSQQQSFKRQNYVSGGRSTEAWLTQKNRVENDTYRIELEHKPSHIRAVFYWPEGAPWWSRATYFRRKRLILSAERVDGKP